MLCNISIVKLLSMIYKILLLKKKFVISLPTQLSHMLQWEALGGRNILHVKQNLSLTVCPFIVISLTRGGGRYVWGS